MRLYLYKINNDELLKKSLTKNKQDNMSKIIDESRRRDFILSQIKWTFV